MISYSDINSLNFQGFQGQNAEMHLKKRVTSKMRRMKGQKTEKTMTEMMMRIIRMKILMMNHLSSKWKL